MWRLFLLVPFSNNTNEQNKSTSGGVQSGQDEGPKCFVDANGVLWRWNYGTQQWDFDWGEPGENPDLDYKWSPADDDDDWRTTARKAKESSRSSYKVDKTNCDWRATPKTGRGEKADRRRKYYHSERGRRQGK